VRLRLVAAAETLAGAERLGGIADVISHLSD
jgi:hypothetical protein